jgi:hypothetical protein
MKIAATLRGRKLPPEVVEKIRRANTGKRKSDEDKRGISERMRGNKHGVGPHTEETRAKMRAKARRGSDSNFWKGGTTEEAKILRQSSQYREWRRQVFERDNYTCQICGERGGHLHPDHIKRFSHFPELRFELSNGRTLCKSCHKQTPTYGRNKALESPANDLVG